MGKYYPFGHSILTNRSKYSLFQRKFLEPKSETEKIEKLRLIFTELGAEREAHWQTLKYLFQHFLR